MSATVPEHDEVQRFLQPIREVLVAGYAATPPGVGIPRVPADVLLSLQRVPTGVEGWLTTIVDTYNGIERDDDTTMAVQLLGAMKAASGLEPVLHLARRHSVESDDHLTTALWHALVSYASVHLDRIVAFMRTHARELGQLPQLFGADVQDERFFAALIECLPASPAAVASALGWQDDPRAVPHLRQCLQSLVRAETDDWCDAVDCLVEALHQLGEEIAGDEVRMSEASAVVRKRLDETRAHELWQVDACRNEARAATTSTARRVELARHEDLETRVELAGCRATDVDVLSILASDPSPRVRALAASHDNLREGDAEVLARDPVNRVRLSLAVAVRTCARVRAILLHDNDPHVRAAAVAYVAAHELPRVLADPHPEVRAAAASREDAPDDVLRACAEDADALVRETVAYHRRTPRDLVERLAHDASPEVQAAARECLPGGHVFTARNVIHISREHGLAALRLTPIVPSPHPEQDA